MRFLVPLGPSLPACDSTCLQSSRFPFWIESEAPYTLGKSYNNTQSITWFPAYSYTPGNDWSRSDNDRRHKFDLLGTFNAGYGISLGTAFSVYSGLPVNITTGGDKNHDGVTVDRPGAVQRNAMHGPSDANLDLNLSRDFYLPRDTRHTGPSMTLSVNSFNVLNHLKPTTYVGVIT